jgi:hypothetical protein
MFWYFPLWNPLGIYFIFSSNHPMTKNQISWFWNFVIVAIWKEKRPRYFFSFGIATTTKIQTK